MDTFDISAIVHSTIVPMATKCKDHPSEIAYERPSGLYRSHTVEVNIENWNHES